MPLGAFYREIATLLGDAIVREAERMTRKISDKKERWARDKEWAELQKSTDPFDQLIVEKVRVGPQESS